MSNSKWRKMLSFALVLVLVFQMMPVSVFAEEIRKLDNESIIIVGEEEAVEGEIIQEFEQGEYSADDVLWEIESKRTATEKHFQLRGGTSLAVSYAYPVHYMDEDGVYREIDNTLELYNADGTLSDEPVISGLISGDELIADASEPDLVDTPSVIVGDDEESSSEQYEGEGAVIIIGGDDSSGYVGTAAIRRADPVIIIGGRDTELPDPENPYEGDGIIIGSPDGEPIVGADESGEENSGIIIGDSTEEEEPEDTLLEEPVDAEEFQIDTRVYKNTAGLADVSLALSAGAGQLASISYGGYSVSLTPRLNTSSAIDETLTGRVARQQAQIAGQVRQLDSVAAANSFQEKITPPNLSSSLLYENLFDKADLEYIVAESSLKENIIVKERASSYVYSFLLDPDGLTPMQMETGSIELRDSNDKAVFVIPAGYMFDANGDSSMEVVYDLERVDDGKYILTVTGDADWINAENRAFPVTIDPPIYMTGFFNLETGTLNERYPNGAGGQVATESLGYYSATGKNCRMLVRVNNLPQIPDNSYVVNSGIYLYEVAYSDINMSSLRIQAQALTSNTPTEGYWCLYHTWNNCPALSGDVIDYVDVGNSRAFYGWNVTREAIKWYNNPAQNYGICLKATREGSMNSGSCANVGFASSNTSNAGARPYFVVEYRNNVGLEDYYTYQSHSINRAGNGYIGDYSGQLTIVKNDVSAASTVNPVEISHVYNSAYSANDYSGAILNAGSKYANMKLGKGWMLNIQQSVSEYGNGYILYADGDGTVHFFAQTATNTYKDEDGLGLTITKNGSNYTLTDRNNNTCYFSDGMLSYMQDANGNRVNYVRNGSNQVTSVTRQNNGASTETIATLSYNGSGYLSSITDSANNTTSYTYDASNRLITVTHADGTTVSYTYNGNSKLASAKDNEAGYSMNYEYNTQTGKVSRFYEMGGATIGREVISDGSFNGTQTYRSNGEDRTINNADDIVTGKVFDYFGRTISGYSSNADSSELYGAASARYSTNSGTSATNNRALVESSVGIQSENYISDGGIEGQTSIGSSSTPWSFTGGGTANIATGKAHTGNKSLSVSRTSSQAESVFSQSITGLVASKWYIISAYVNTSQTTTPGEAFIRVGTSAGTPVLWNSGEVGEGWERIYHVAKSNSDGTLSIQAVAKAADGIVCFDDFQVEPANSIKSYLDSYADKLAAPSSVNLLSNGNMTTNSGWAFSNSNNISYVSDSTFGKAIKITGDSYSNFNVSQTVNINLPGTQTYFYSGWAKAASVPLTGSRSFSLRAVIKYSDNTQEVQTQSFSADSTQWQYNVLPIVPKEPTKTVSTIQVEFTYNLNPNTVYFANAGLTREEAKSYKYNSDGELVSVSSPGNDENTFTYSGADLISQLVKGFGEYSYEYDSKHNMTKASNDGVSMSVSYDTKGNTSGTALSAIGTNSTVSTSATYDTNGNLLTSQTDARGNTTTYAYENNISKRLGSPTLVTDAGGTAQKMSYNGTNGRIFTTEIEGTAKVENTYSAGRVSQVSSSGAVPGSSEQLQTGYGLRYDDFGNVRQVNYTGYFFPAKELSRSKNGQPFQLNMGGYEVYYRYDDLERMSYVEDWDDYYLLYAYTGSGELGKLSDLKENREYNYTYDSLDRLSAMTEYSGGNAVQTFRCGYDEANRVVKIDYKVSPSWNGTFRAAKSYNYTYDNDDGTLTSLLLPESDLFSYGYDALKRLNTRTLKKAGSTFMTREYTYLQGNGNNGTTLIVDSITNKNASGSTISEFSYTYDALSNITGISGDTSASYTYDEQGQLLTETIGDRQYTYTYDGLGNIRSKSLTVNGATTTETFGYNNNSLRGFLSDYNGNSISYGLGGTPNQWYNGNAMVFDRGTQLVKVSNNSTGLNIELTYDANNFRLTKTNGNITHKYTWQGNKLISDAYDGKELEFLYDESNKPYAFSYKASATASPVMYYYVTNLQGDILSVVDGAGAEKASYTYNAWGELISSSGTMAEINPLRYRGYYYDEDLGFYYLHNRYYDPVICRFISPDENLCTGQGIVGNNMFAYCCNNPVSRVDSEGTFFNTIFGTIVGGITAVVTRDKDAETWQQAMVRGATTGLIAGAALDFSIATGGAGAILIATIGGAIAGGLDSYWEQKNHGGDIDVGKIAIDATLGAGMNTLFGAYGRTAGRAVGNTVSTVFSAMKQNTWRSISTVSGRFLMPKFIKSTGLAAVESVTQAGFSKLFSCVSYSYVK